MFFNFLDSLFKFPDRSLVALKLPSRVIFHLKFPGSGDPIAPLILQPWCQAATDDDVKRILDFIIHWTLSWAIRVPTEKFHCM